MQVLLPCGAGGLGGADSVARGPGRRHVLRLVPHRRPGGGRVPGRPGRAVGHALRRGVHQGPTPSSCPLYRCRQLPHFSMSCPSVHPAVYRVPPTLSTHAVPIAVRLAVHALHCICAVDNMRAVRTSTVYCCCCLFIRAIILPCVPGGGEPAHVHGGTLREVCPGGRPPACHRGASGLHDSTSAFNVCFQTGWT
jgi:hypothetical protein